jgi:N-acetylmuramoyl-L-alanine amidase
MKIGLRGGHSPNCKGAIGLIDEQAEVRKIYNELVPMLQAVGHTVVDCNSNASNVSSELADGTNKANGAGCDIYGTLHMNAAESPEAGGVEVWLYDASNPTMNMIASNICKNFEEKGFANRGVKYSSGYHDLNASNMPGMIVETLFCTGAGDVARYRNLGTKGIAELIAKAIDSRTSAENGQGNQNTKTDQEGEETMQCMFTVEGKGCVYWMHDGVVTPLGHPDEMKILQEIYKANYGHDMPTYSWSKPAPWHIRLMEPLYREPKKSI